jgi:hypothetical protein
MRSLGRSLPPIALICCSLMTAGCSSSSSSGSLPTAAPLVSNSETPSDTPSLPGCKLPKRILTPSWLPDDLPLPHGLYASQRLGESTGYHRGLFVIPLSTQQFVRYVLDKWPKAGWQLGRGDAEPGEAEDQFIKGKSFGAFKAQDMACSPPHSIVLLVYAPDRTNLPGASTSGGSPLPGESGRASPSESP